MFIKRKIRAGKANTYRMILSVKMLETNKKVLTSRRATVSVVRQLLLDITRFFAAYCPMFGAALYIFRPALYAKAQVLSYYPMVS